MQNINTDRIKFEQIIAGALLKLERLDNVDISLLLEDFINANIAGVNTYFNIEYLEDYMCFSKDGSITINYNKPLNYFIEAENRTVKNKYIEVAGDLVISFFENFDIKEFKRRKEKLLADEKKTLLNEGNILLISDDEEEYKALAEYGFKNIDYFRSIIRADRYFAKHPKELEKYNIIFKGNQEVQHCCFENDTKLDLKLDDLRYARKVMFIKFYHAWKDEKRFLDITLLDYKNHRSWEAKDESYGKIFDKIVEAAIINHLTKPPIKATPIEDYINPNKFPLPSYKRDLQILYLDTIKVSEHAKEVANTLGLNVIFKEDNNNSLGKYVKGNLGNFDIIITSDTYSRNILRMNNESTEQCKDTGRELTLLMTYDDDSIWQFDEDCIMDHIGFGDKITINYIFGGNLANDQNINQQVFRVLRKPETSDNDVYVQRQISNMEGILAASVSLYNKKLAEVNKPTLEDNDLKSPEYYDSEYSMIEAREDLRKSKALEPINIFDSLTFSVEDFIRYKNEGLIASEVEGIQITSSGNEICVENTLNGRTLCSIVFSKNDTIKNLRIFKIQTLSNKGNLSDFEVVGVYTRKYENVEGVPERPTEQQMKALLATLKKVKTIIVPLNIQAREKFETLSEKEKNRIRRKWNCFF